MKHLKKYEIFNSFNLSNENDLIEKIRDTVDSLSYDYAEYDEFNPFEFPEIKTELALISEKEDIESIYDIITPDISLEEFTILYNRLVKDSEEKIIKYLKEKPFRNNIDNITSLLDIPQWIIDANKIMNKYNI